jgi:hypothetical protein
MKTVLMCDNLIYCKSKLNVFEDRKLELFHECLEIILKPFEKASHMGVALIDSFGDPQFVYLLLYAYVCDHLKGYKVHM